jgi:hypothetical protein
MLLSSVIFVAVEIEKVVKRSRLKTDHNAQGRGA